MKISMIAAMSRNRVVGTGMGGIPWHLPRDTAHFRKYVESRTMVLGRATYEEMAGWFSLTQVPLILTSDRDYEPNPGITASSIEHAIRLASAAGREELVICGGASVYQAALEFADELVLTIVDTEIENGVHFPDYESTGDWKVASFERFEADEENKFAMEFFVLTKKGS